MKNINPLGMFDEHHLLEKLTKLKDPHFIPTCQLEDFFSYS
jgi:hypothetical protein